MAKKRNPVLQKAWMEGYNAGLKAGHKEACYVFAHKFEQLQEAKGIGPKTMKRVVEAMDLPLEEVKDEGY